VKLLHRPLLVMAALSLLGLSAVLATFPVHGQANGPTATLVAQYGKLAFVSRRDSNAQIYTVNPDGTNPVNLSNNKFNDIDPASSPDGLHWAFASDRDGNNELCVMDIDGSNQHCLTNNATTDKKPDKKLPEDRSPVWSPDNQRIAFISTRNGSQQIYAVNVDGSNPLDLSNNKFNNSQPAWSPDLKQIAFVSDREGNTEICMMDASGFNQRCLTNNRTPDKKPNPTKPQDSSPAWSPDSQKLAFVSNRERNRNRQILVMNVDGSNPTNITKKLSTDEQPAWSPDGAQIAFVSNREGARDIFVMNPDGSNQKRLIRTPRNEDVQPAYAPGAPSTLSRPPTATLTFTPTGTIQFTPPPTETVTPTAVVIVIAATNSPTPTMIPPTNTSAPAQPTFVPPTNTSAPVLPTTTPSNTPITPTITTTPSNTPITPTKTPSNTATLTPSNTATITPTFTATATSTIISSSTDTITPSSTPTITPSASCLGVIQIPIIECNYLVSLYNATGGANWTTKTGWLANNTPCSWYGITCANGHVTSISIGPNNIVGTLQSNLTSLTAIQTFDIHQNNLTGTIPLLPSTLTLLDLSYNNLSGTIPVFPAGLTNLAVDSNQLTGTIPVLPNTLIVLRVGSNNLTGAIPALPASLQFLSTAINSLTGQVPASISSTAIASGKLFLCGGNNVLTPANGTVDAFVTARDTTWTPSQGCGAPVAACVGQSQIPTTECNYLVSLYNSTGGANWTTKTGWLANNTPCSWFRITCANNHVTRISLGLNNLIGAIPANLTDLTTLQYLDLIDNQLTGSIPPLPTGLQYLNLTTSQLTGSIPLLPTGLLGLYLGSNQLTGSIPLLPTGLQYLSLGSNQLTGSIPILPTSLHHLFLDHNQLSGLVPTSITSTAIVSGYLSLCGGANVLAPANTGVDTWVQVRGVTGWTPGIGCVAGNPPVPPRAIGGPSPTTTVRVLPSATPNNTATITPTLTLTSSVTSTATPTASRTPSATYLPPGTATATSTRSSTPSATNKPTLMPTPDATTMPSRTNTATLVPPSATASPIPQLKPSLTAMGTIGPVRIPTLTPGNPSASAPADSLPHIALLPIMGLIVSGFAVRRVGRC